MLEHFSVLLVAGAAVPIVVIGLAAAPIAVVGLVAAPLLAAWDEIVCGAPALQGQNGVPVPWVQFGAVVSLLAAYAALSFQYGESETSVGALSAADGEFVLVPCVSVAIRHCGALSLALAALADRFFRTRLPDVNSFFREA